MFCKKIYVKKFRCFRNISYSFSQLVRAKVLLVGLANGFADFGSMEVEWKGLFGVGGVYPNFYLKLLANYSLG